jgi:predicted nucleotidyltransferase
MLLEDFFRELKEKTSEEGVLDLCRKHVLHGTPYVFYTRDKEFYEFRKRIAYKFNIPFNEIYITGSGKLGFSPFKNKRFDYDSDIDVAIVSEKLFDKIMSKISPYQMGLRQHRDVIHIDELKMYHSFLEYIALGWIRPDKLPLAFQMNAFKDDWFEFFRSISYGKSEVGNYKVNAGVFKSYQHLEDYTFEGIINLKKSKILEKK